MHGELALGELTRSVLHYNLSEHWQHLRTEWMKNYGCFLVPQKPASQVIDLIFMGNLALPCSHIQGPSNLYGVWEGAGGSILPGFVEEKQGKI